MENRYAPLVQFLDQLTGRCGLKLCIKDYTGFIRMDSELFQALLPYLTHSNPYCLHIKHDKQRFAHCVNMMKRMAGVCMERECSFCGTCYAGVREWIVPIFEDSLLLGAICAGYLPVELEEAHSRIDRAMGDASAAERERALELYHDYIVPNEADVEAQLPALQFVASYLSSTYRFSRFTLDSKELVTRRSAVQTRMLCQHVVDYITLHASEEISVQEIADYCFVSVSTISHIFKKNLGCSINTFINKIRIERAKELLLNTNDPIEQIGAAVGIPDASYFSRVFKQLIGFSPSKFRQRFR